VHRRLRQRDSRSRRPLDKLVHYAISLRGPIPPAVLAGEEPIHLHIFLNAQRATTPSPPATPAPSSPLPIRIPPRHESPINDSFNEDIIYEEERFFTPPRIPSPTPSYYEAEVVPASPTIAISEEALSDDGTQLGDDEILRRQLLQEEEDRAVELPEDLAVGGWVHLQQNLVNHVIRRIHDNPEFFPALVLQFEGQSHIFGEHVRGLESLHLVCRRLERQAIIRRAEGGEVNLWDEFFEEQRDRAEALAAIDYQEALRRQNL